MNNSVVLKNLSPWDIATFITYTMILLGVGLYFTRKQKTLKTFLVANQSVPWFIVGISVLAALFSGVTYLGAPAEAFFHDLTYTWGILAMFIATPITAMIFVPLFRKSQIYTAYEYLEQRFDVRLRYIASGMFILRVTFYLAVVIYAPSLAVMEVTGWPLWLAVLLIASCATIYTCFGGMQAVIWTDTVQFLVLCGGIVVILCFAASKVPGGLTAAWHVAAADGKTGFFHFSLDPRVRVTVWGCLLGGATSTLVQLVTDQMAVQRYLTAPSLSEGLPQRSLAEALDFAAVDFAVLYCRHRAVCLLPRDPGKRADLRGRASRAGAGAADGRAFPPHFQRSHPAVFRRACIAQSTARTFDCRTFARRDDRHGFLPAFTHWRRRH